MINRLNTIALRAAVAVVVAVGGWGVAHAVDPRITDEDVRQMREQAAHSAGADFLDRYVEDDGRVVRRDEGGDVVSEGQAYGMLIAVALGDEARFRTIWEWTATHLRRPDGVLSWRWADGRVTDPNSATDADLDAARSLVLAGQRFGDPALGEDGERLGADILRTETVSLGTPGQRPGLVTVAGNWATGVPSVVNPGYFSPRAEQELRDTSSNRQWSDIGRTQRVLAWRLAGAGELPPDWAAVAGDGRPTPAPPPGGGAVHFGLDAARLPIRFAESCDAEDRALAASLRPLVAGKGDVPAVRALDGSAADDWQHPVAVVSAAATEHAAGDTEAAAARLDKAAALQQRYPTYFGAAWVALGRIMLDTRLLGECPPG